MQFLRLTLLALALLLPAQLVSGPARAQGPAQPLTLRAGSCQTWNTAKPQSGQPASAARASQLSFLFNYVAAHDQEPDRDYYAGQIDLTEGIDAAEVATWIDEYCAANPRDGFEQVAAALVRDLSARWITSKNNRR